MKRTSLELMTTATKGAYAIPAFNIDNLESAIAVTTVIKELKTPVIIQMIPRTLRYGGIAVYPAMIDALMADSDVDYAIHLDHGSDYDLANECIKSGFSSVMYDGSALSFEENCINTARVSDLALKQGISVEGELGTIGGKEEGDTELESKYTKVSEAVEYVARTNVSILAIAVGTAHGVYKGTPVINTTRIKEIRNAINTPLVLHGASGLSDQVLQECIANGISKINFATELRQAFTRGLKQGLAEFPSDYDPKIYLPHAINEIKTVVKNKIITCYGL